MSDSNRSDGSTAVAGGARTTEPPPRMVSGTMRSVRGADTQGAPLRTSSGTFAAQSVRPGIAPLPPRFSKSAETLPPSESDAATNETTSVTTRTFDESTVVMQPEQLLEVLGPSDDDADALPTTPAYRPPFKTPVMLPQLYAPRFPPPPAALRHEHVSDRPAAVPPPSLPRDVVIGYAIAGGLLFLSIVGFVTVLLIR